MSHSYQVEVAQKNECVYCGSETIQFVEFDRISRRLDEKKVLATEIWVCDRCDKEFERTGTLYSPQDLSRTRFRIAALTWIGYSVGSLIAYALLYNALFY